MRSKDLLDAIKYAKAVKGLHSNLITFTHDLAGEERTFFSEEPGILFILSGRMQYQIGADELRTLHQGEYLFYPKGITVSFGIEMACSSLLFPLTREMTENFVQMLEKYRNFSTKLLKVPNRVCIMQEKWTDQMEIVILRLLKDYAKGNDFFIHLSLCELMYLIFPDEHMLSKFSYILDVFYYPESIRIVEGFLLENYHQPLRVKNIVEIANISESQLNRLYKKYIQLSPMERLTAIRIEQAALLLRNQSLTVTDVAGQVGYQSMSAFNQQFKRKFAVSPKDYQSSYKK
jgi:AraC-like DNA-binding protein